MGLGTNLILTPKYVGARQKNAIENAQTRIDELLVGQNDLNSDVKNELEALNAMLGGGDQSAYTQGTQLAIITSHEEGHQPITDDPTMLDQAITDNGYNAITVMVDGEIYKANLTTYVAGPDDPSEGSHLELENLDGTVVDFNSINFPANTPIYLAEEAEQTIAGNIDEIKAKIQVLNDIFSQTGTANDVFDALVILAEAWNDGEDLVAKRVVTYTDTAGEINVDLSAFSFSDVSDFEILATVDGTGARYASVGIDKVDTSNAKITLWDNACFVEDGVKYDGSVNAVRVSLLVAYNRPTLSFNITDADGNVTAV